MTTNSVSAASVEEIPVAEVVIGPRRRAKLGRIQALANSIETHGLVHPILVRNGRELVAGQRRLEAYKRLGRKQIPARHVDGLSDDQMRAIELDENTEREALNDYETSKARLAEIRQAEADLKAKAEAENVALAYKVFGEDDNGNTVTEKKKRGRPKEPGSKRHVAEVTGITRAGRANVERHVTLAEQYPFLQRGGWVQHRVLHAGELMEQLPKAERPKVAALLDQDGIPPSKAIDVLQNVAKMPDGRKAKMFSLAQSEDNHDRTTALTIAADVPPPPDPGFIRLGNADHELRLAAKACRTPKFKQKVANLSAGTTKLLKDFEKYIKEEK